MAHLSGYEIINQLDGNKSITFYQKENSIIFAEPKNNHQRRLSPWLGKRRHSKNFKMERKISQQHQSQKTDQFLRKIFPHRRNKSMKIATEAKQINLQVTNQVAQSERKLIQQQQCSFIYLPIQAINLQKITPKKQPSKKVKQQSPTKCFIHPVEPLMQIKQENEQNLKQMSKPTPMNVTFRRSWRKNHQRSKTQAYEIGNQINKKISINQMYRLIGKDQLICKTQYGNFYQFKNTIRQRLNQPKNKSYQQNKISWLVSRTLKNNKYIKNKSLACKIQNF